MDSQTKTDLPYRQIHSFVRALARLRHATDLFWIVTGGLRPPATIYEPRRVQITFHHEATNLKSRLNLE
jgi:hypothetical protein